MVHNCLTKAIDYLQKNDIIIRMRNIILGFVIGLSVIFSSSAIAEDVMPVQIDIREYDGIEVPAGTFIPVENAQEISTQYCPDGYKVQFISTNDLYMHDTKIIPESTVFIGYMDEVHDPVVGTNASFKVKITKMVLPDGFEIPVKGYLYSSNNNQFGGELTQPAEWIKMPHYQGNIGINTTLQIRPGRTRKKGTHTVIQAGEDGLIILTDPLTVTHTLTN